MDNSLVENKIIFTQDIPGEREWIQSQFPGYSNLETVSSGKWSSEFPLDTDQKNLYEIAFSDHHDVNHLLNCNLTKVKSFYNHYPESVIEDNIHWVCADQFISNVSYKPFSDKPKFWVLNIARSGTMFTETLLSQYRSKLQSHAGTGSNLHLMQIYDTCKSNTDTAIVFVYRRELWETFTSNVIASHHGIHHGNNFNWSFAKPIAITDDDMLHFQVVLISTLNFWCNLRSLLPTHSMLLLDGSKTIQQYKHQVNHPRVNYNKQTLISNYDEFKDKWDNVFNKNLTKMLDNTISHLEKMNCKQNLDHLI